MDMPVRWNSTYEFLATALKMKKSLQKLLIQDEDLSSYMIESTGWDRIKVVADFLKVINILTLVFYGSD